MRSGLREDEVSSRDIVAACYDAIAARDGKLHAFVDLWRDDALAQADARDLERRNGCSRGPLHGLPIALKDLLHVAGRQTTAGSKSWLGRLSDHTATAVSRLVAAGMIPLGKTHMVEFAFGGWGRNPPMGAPWNPWDLRTHRVAGGSSSGSAVAVAAGMAPAAIGSDTGGSIRIPSALCGLTGLKPTYGLVSLYGAVPLSATLDSIGPLARSVDDAALLVAAMAGPDPHDPATLNAPAVDFGDSSGASRNLAGVRIAVLAPDRLRSSTLPEIVQATRDASDVLRDLGATVTIEDIPIDFDKVAEANGRIIAAEAWALHRAYIEDETLDIDPWVRRRVIGGKAITGEQYRELLARAAARDVRVRRLDARTRCAAHPDAADHRDAARRRRRGHGAACDVHPRRELSGRVRALAAGGIFRRRPARRCATAGRCVHRCRARAHRPRVPVHDALASQASGPPRPRRVRFVASARVEPVKRRVVSPAFQRLSKRSIERSRSSCGPSSHTLR